MKTVSAAQANREFSKLLAGVLQGEVFTVVSRGTPVATMGPATSGAAQRISAHKTLMARLKTQHPHKASGRKAATREWNRDDLYGD
jgi:prevent-host-death family protein